MAVPACLRLADEVFPRVRAAAAHRLVAAGWSQTRAGQAVGLSQAMVSRYLAAPPPDDPVALRLADDLVESVLRPAPAKGPSGWCTTLSVGQDRPGGDEALADVLAAERSLRAAAPLRLVPQVGLNLARALPHAASPDDVLAFPGRLVEANGVLLSPAPPAFGGSGHVARVLLELRRNQPDVLALANVRASPAIVAAARGMGLAVVKVPRGPKTTGEEPVLLAARTRRGVALHDPGAIGLEPCLYLAGPDARAVASSILRLHDVLVNP